MCTLNVQDWEGGLQVAILGAGLSGLSGALALLQASEGFHRIEVFEASEQLPTSRHIVEVSLDALYAIYTISPELYKRVASLGMPVVKHITHRVDGHTEVVEGVVESNGGWDIPGRPASLLRPHDAKRSNPDHSPGAPSRKLSKSGIGRDPASCNIQGPLLVVWGDLLAAFASRLPAAALRLSAPVSSLREDIDSVCLQLSNGDQIRTQVLLGCSGGCDAFTKWLGLPPHPHPATLGWYISGETPDSMPLEEGTVCTYQGKASRATIHALTRNIYSVTVVTPANDGGPDGMPAEARLHNALSGFSQDLLRLLPPPHPMTAAPQGCGAVPRVTAFSGPVPVPPDGATSLWGRGRASLLGNTVFAVPPASPQATTLALQAAVEVAHSLSEHGVTAAALRSYETHMSDRVCCSHMEGSGVASPGQASTPGNGSPMAGSPARFRRFMLNRELQSFSGQSPLKMGGSPGTHTSSFALRMQDLRPLEPAGGAWNHPPSPQLN